MKHTISVIATVLNEGESLRNLMDSLVAQTRPPDEIVIVDGGSRDNTVAILQSYCDTLPLRIVIEPGCNISQGRNRAIAAAHGDIIAATDAGLWLSPDWVEKLACPFETIPDLHLVGGFFEADARSLFEIAMGAAVSRLVDEIKPDTFLPGSRSLAYLKSDWSAVGGYPEWLDFSEDMVFILNLRRLSSRFVFAPEAIVHFRPRSTFRAFFKQYYHYACGDGKADLWRFRHLARYTTYVLAIPLIALLGIVMHPAFWLLYLPGAAFYLYQPYRRLSHALYTARRTDLRSVLTAAVLLPIIRVVGDAGKMSGYPTGLYWRWRNPPPDWQYDAGTRS
jgi:glycosyltransferase involved in cell wall biosynthesis